MTFTIEQGDPAVITIDGNVIGGAEAMEFSRALGEVVRGGTHRVIVDLAGVPVMNSSGLGMLVSALATARNAGGALVVAAANEKIQNLFKMTRLDLVLPCHPTRDAAIDALR